MAADPTLRRESAVKALEFGAGSGNAEVPRLLLDHYRPVDLDNGEDREDEEVLAPSALSVTPLALSAGARSGSEEMTQLLLRRGRYREESSEGDSWKGDRLTASQRKSLLRGSQQGRIQQLDSSPTTASRLPVPARPTGTLLTTDHGCRHSSRSR